MRYHDWLDKAERHLANQNQRAAFGEFEGAAYNPSYVQGGAEEVLARGRKMRHDVGGKYSAKWDKELTRLEAQVAAAPNLGNEETFEQNPQTGSEASTARIEIPATVSRFASPQPQGRAGVETRREPPVTTSGLKMCPDCAEDVRERARKCRYCGYEFAKACPECAEDVRPEATKCRHCGHRFSPPNTDAA